MASPGPLRGDDRSYTGYRRSGIRLGEPADPLLEAPAQPAGMTSDEAVCYFDRAHIVMLSEESIIPAYAAASCLVALEELAAEGWEGAQVPGDGRHFGEGALIRRLGMEVGGYIHAGRSSWDLGGISQRLSIRSGLLEVAGDLNDYREALLDLAERHLETVMPYYTHGQHGQPTTLAHHLHAFVCVAERDFRRMDQAYRTVNVSQAGAAAGTATRFPVDRERITDLLGFGTTASNTRDASMNHDYLWEGAAVASLLAASLGSLADELILWCSQEYNLIRMADRWCHTSSIMTQKRNPTAAEKVQSIRKQLGGRSPVSYTGPEVVATLGAVRQAVQLLTGVVSTLHVNVDLMRERSNAFWGQASDLAALLVQERRLPWRMAHQTVGIMVRLAEEEGIEPEEATPSLLDRAAVLFLGEPLGLSASHMADALDAAACVRTRTATGSPGPAEMRRQIEVSREVLAADRDRTRSRYERLEAAQRRLDEAVAEALARTGENT
ncbi:MAG: hypothetical protein CL878_00885 [Dehalococcoidia bacterium]|nr:hypothetical protein [Dehalococcoidia bacterium]